MQEGTDRSWSSKLSEPDDELLRMHLLYGAVRQSVHTECSYVISMRIGGCVCVCLSTVEALENTFSTLLLLLLPGTDIHSLAIQAPITWSVYLCNVKPSCASLSVLFNGSSNPPRACPSSSGKES